MKIQANGSEEFENIFAGFRIQTEISTDFRILQLQRMSGIHLFFWTRILDFACISNIFVRISDSGRKWKGGLGL